MLFLSTYIASCNYYGELKLPSDWHDAAL